MAWLTVPSIERPSLSRGFARHAGESIAPQQWKGLVGDWAPVLGHQGDRLYDVSGYANHGTLTNMAPASDWIVGIDDGMALDFDGADDVVLCGAGPAIANLLTLTWSAWIHPRSVGETYGRIISKEETGVAAFLWYLMNDNVNSIGYSHFYSGGATGDWGTAANTITMNAWQHVAVTYDSNSTANVPVFYINGRVQTPLTTWANPVGTRPSDATVQLRIGNNQLGTRTFDGRIAEVRLYSRILTPEEVWALYDPATRWAMYERMPQRWMTVLSAVETTVGSLPPDAILASTNLTGAVTDIDDDPDSPDGAWATATSSTAATDLRVSFPTP